MGKWAWLGTIAYSLFRKEAFMAQITIKDLPQDDDLDRQAMSTLVGGARNGLRPMTPERPPGRGNAVVDYPPGFGRNRPAPSEGGKLPGA